MCRRNHRGQNSQQTNKQRYLPSVDNLSYVKSHENYPIKDDYIANLKQVKIRIKGKPDFGYD